MQKHFLINVLFFLISTVSFSQWSSNFSADTETYVFADIVEVKSAPSLESTAIDTLSAGYTVLIKKSMAETSVLNGIEAKWVQISYTKNGIKQDGYVWSGFLAFNPLRKGEIKFVYGADRIFKKDSIDIFDLEIKVYRKEKQVGIFKFPLDYYSESFSFISANVYDNKGLKNIEQIIEIEIGGEACGISNRIHYFGFGNNEIISIFNTVSVFDEDYYKEDLVFPTDKGGKPNVVFLKTENSEDTGKNDKKGNPIYIKKKETKLFKWNGKVLSQYKN